MLQICTVISAHCTVKSHVYLNVSMLYGNDHTRNLALVSGMYKSGLPIFCDRCLFDCSLEFSLPEFI